MASTARLLVDRSSGVATLTIARPEVRNAIDEGTMEELEAVLDTLESDASLVSVILTGSGERAFCAGGDLRWMKTLTGPEQGEAMSRRMQSILGRLSDLPVPVLAALNGHAVGGGTEIALAADLRFASENASLDFRQARMGLAPGWGGAVRLRRVVGYSRAFELLATGARLSAVDALGIGLVDRVVPKGGAVAEARRWSERVRPSSGRSVSVIKRMLRAPGADDALDREATLFAEVWASPEHREAVAAFFEKRTPRLRQDG